MNGAWSTTDALEPALATLAERALVERRPLLGAWTVALPNAIDPLDFFRRAPNPERFYFERASEDLAFASIGAVRELEASTERFGAMQSQAETLLASLHEIGGGQVSDRPRLVGGFAFSPHRPSPAWANFPPALLTLPELIVGRSGEDGWCTQIFEVTTATCWETLARILRMRRATIGERVGGGGRSGGAYHPIGDPEIDGRSQYRVRGDEGQDVFRARVRLALDGIADGSFEKVVPARSVAVERAAPYDPSDLLDTLRTTHPSCAVFAAGRSDSIFLGATPERLVRLRDGRIETAALAGSARRGRTPEQDERLARALRESKKEQAEHAIVVRALRESLSPFCVVLDVPEAPRLARLDGIQHLETPLRGHTRSGVGVIELVEALHPTPAVAGYPREASLAWLERTEALDRGWYAGPIGFVERGGGGEFCVALRSALVRGGRAELFAGAGVVQGSDPENELRETRLKLRALLAPLLEI